MAQFASDSFTGTSGTVLSSYSAKWLKHGSSGAGTIVISDANRARANSSSEAIYYNTDSPSSADYSVSADIVVISTDGANCSVLGRVSTSANTFYMARYDTASGGWQLYKRVSGTFTQLGSTSTQTFTTGTKNVKLEMIGSAIKLYKEGSGTATISATDSSITAAGQSGLRVAATATDSTSMHLDNFSGDDAASLTYTLYSPTMVYSAGSWYPQVGETVA